MSQQNANDILSLNLYYKNKLNNSITFSIYDGHFNQARNLIEVSSMPTSSIDLNETDQWWITNPSINNRKKRIF